MNREQILDIFRTLAQSQGMYGRLLANLTDLQDSDPDQYEAIMSELEAQNFKDAVSLVMYLET